MNRTLSILPGLALILAMLAACSPRPAAAIEAPRQVASYPKYDQVNPLPPPYPEPPTGRSYSGVMQVRVEQLDDAAEKTTWLVQHYGGYVESSYRQPYTSNSLVMQLVFPTERIEDLRRELDLLGDVEDERWDASPARWPEEAWSRLSLTLYRRPQVVFPQPPPKIYGWNPAATFQAALQVFVRIFGFLVDLAIWVVVVPGPFAILAWLAWRVIRRRQPSNPQ